MNVYDTANKLAGEIKQSEEYMNYKMAKQALSLNSKLKEQLQEFEKIRYEVQVELMQTGKNNEEKYKKMQDSYSELIQDAEAKRFFGMTIISKWMYLIFKICPYKKKKLNLFVGSL